MLNPHDEILEKVKEKTGINLTDLVGMSRSNDPFYKGTKSHIKMAKWFKEVFDEYGERGIHLRGLHYKILNQVEHFDGGSYRNIEDHWNDLDDASLCARYMELIDPNALTDKRNAQADEFVPYGDLPTFKIETEDVDIRLPQIRNSIEEPEVGFPELESKLVREKILTDIPISIEETAKLLQPYHLEIWIEKSSMNDIIKPFCKEKGINFLQGNGHPSVTRVYDFLQRVKEIGKPAHIFYISDYDIAGQSMPKAVARKIEYFNLIEGLDLDISLEPIAITPEQIKKYDLPRSPKNNAVELDALEALHSGELLKILEDCVASRTITDLEDDLEEKQDNIEDTVESIEDDLEDKFGQQIEDLRDRLSSFQSKYKRKLEEQISDIKEDFENELDEEEIEDLEEEIKEFVEERLEEVEIPDIEKENFDYESNGDLFDSRRDYLSQLKAYNEFQKDYEEALKN